MEPAPGGNDASSSAHVSSSSPIKPATKRGKQNVACPEPLAPKAAAGTIEQNIAPAPAKSPPPKRTRAKKAQQLDPDNQEVPQGANDEKRKLVSSSPVKPSPTKPPTKRPRGKAKAKMVEAVAESGNPSSSSRGDGLNPAENNPEAGALFGFEAMREVPQPEVPAMPAKKDKEADTKTAWSLKAFCVPEYHVCAIQEPELRSAGVPIPADFKGEAKSYTLGADPSTGRRAIGVLWLGVCPVVAPCLDVLRWHAGSFYIYGCGSGGGLPDGLQPNKSGGVTVTFKKRGGIKPSWDLAKKVAQWK